MVKETDQKQMIVNYDFVPKNIKVIHSTSSII